MSGTACPRGRPDAYMCAYAGCLPGVSCRLHPEPRDPMSVYHTRDLPCPGCATDAEPALLRDRFLLECLNAIHYLPIPIPMHIPMQMLRAIAEPGVHNVYSVNIPADAKPGDTYYVSIPYEFRPKDPTIFTSTGCACNRAHTGQCDTPRASGLVSDGGITPEPQGGTPRTARQRALATLTHLTENGDAVTRLSAAIALLAELNARGE